MPSTRKPVRASAATLLDQTAGTKIAQLRSQGTTSSGPDLPTSTTRTLRLGLGPFPFAGLASPGALSPVGLHKSTT